MGSFHEQEKGVLGPFFLGHGDPIQLRSLKIGGHTIGLAELKFQIVFTLQLSHFNGIQLASYREKIQLELQHNMRVERMQRD